MKPPVISVVIPTYNEEKFLPLTLKSLSNQTFKLPYEIIVVDNNSTDNTTKIARSYNAHIVKEKKQGYAYACNKGFYNTRGEIIARADADYVLPKDWLEKIWKTFQKDKNLIALGGPTYPLEVNFWEGIIYYPAILLWMYFLKFSGRGFLFPNMAVKRKAFLKTKGFNTKNRFGEDTDMCLQLVKIGKVKLCPSIYIYASSRRLRSMGFSSFVFGYGFTNQIVQALGKQPHIGLEPIRAVPTQPMRTNKPWFYLIVSPILILLTCGVIATTKASPAITTKAKGEFKKVMAFKSKINFISQQISPYLPNSNESK